MTTSQQPRYGRHARPAAAFEPSVPAQRPPSAVRARTVGEYVELTREAGDEQPAFGEWPYGPRKQPEPEPEPVGPNPYLSEGAATDVTLPPGGWPGTAALVIGAAGVALAMAPTTAVIVWPLTILGVILGVVGVRRVRTGSARNGVAAVTGIVFSLAGLAVCAAWITMFAMAGLNTEEPAEASVPTGLVQTVR